MMMIYDQITIHVFCDRTLLFKLFFFRRFCNVGYRWTESWKEGALI